jgi:telomere length regulation protein
MVRELYTSVLGKGNFSAPWGSFFDLLRLHEQTVILQSIFRDIEKTYFSSDDGKGNESDEIIGGVAALLFQITKGRNSLDSQIQVWLATGHGAVIHTIGLRRSLVLQYSSDEGKVPLLLIFMIAS